MTMEQTIFVCLYRPSGWGVLSSIVPFSRPTKYTEPNFPSAVTSAEISPFTEESVPPTVKTAQLSNEIVIPTLSIVYALTFPLNWLILLIPFVNTDDSSSLARRLLTKAKR